MYAIFVLYNFFQTAIPLPLNRKCEFLWELKWEFKVIILGNYNLIVFIVLIVKSVNIVMSQPGKPSLQLKFLFLR